MIDFTNFDVTGAGAVTAATSVTSPSYTGTAAVALSSGGTSALTLDSASGTISFSGDNLSNVGSITAVGGITLSGAGVGMDLSGTGNLSSSLRGNPPAGSADFDGDGYRE